MQRREQPCRTRAYTQEAQQAIRHAQQEACRQGSMFLAPPHLLQARVTAQCTPLWSNPPVDACSSWPSAPHHPRVRPADTRLLSANIPFPTTLLVFTQGLLDAEGCSACQVLNAAGLSADKAEAALVDPQMVPAHSVVSAGDLHWAPDARKALQIAAELCTYTGACAAAHAAAAAAQDAPATHARPAAALQVCVCC